MPDKGAVRQAHDKTNEDTSNEREELDLDPQVPDFLVMNDRTEDASQDGSHNGRNKHGGNHNHGAVLSQPIEGDGGSQCRQEQVVECELGTGLDPGEDLSHQQPGLDQVW